MEYEWYITPEHYRVAKQNGISAKRLTERVRDYAWHIERAITTPVQSHKQWAEWLVIAKQNNITNTTFYTRIYRDGMDPERASSTPPMPRDERMKLLAEKRRRYPKEYEVMALANGITKYAFISRMNRKWDIAKAATTPMEIKYRRKVMV